MQIKTIIEFEKENPGFNRRHEEYFEVVEKDLAKKLSF